MWQPNIKTSSLPTFDKNPSCVSQYNTGQEKLLHVVDANHVMWALFYNYPFSENPDLSVRLALTYSVNLL